MTRSDALGMRTEQTATNSAVDGAIPEITVVHAPACHFCDDADTALNELGSEFTFRVTHIDARTPEGQNLLQNYRATMTPLVLLDGRYVSSGRLPRGKVRKLLDARGDNRRAR